MTSIISSLPLIPDIWMLPAAIADSSREFDKSNYKHFDKKDDILIKMVDKLINKFDKLNGCFIWFCLINQFLL